MKEQLIGNITCPKCNNILQIEIPTDKCVLFLKCEKCGGTSTPTGDDCCIFCSYGDRKCPVSEKK